MKQHLQFLGILAIAFSFFFFNPSTIWAQCGGGNPVAIPDGNGDGGGDISDISTLYCSDVVIPSGTNPVDVDWTAEFPITHTWIGDLTIQIFPPAATGSCAGGAGDGTDTIVLMHRPGGGAGEFGEGCNLVASDPLIFNLGAACTAGSDPELIENTVDPLLCDNIVNPHAPNADDSPQQSTFPACDMLGCPSEGVWTVCIGDHADQDTGELESWGLDPNGEGCVTLPVELISFDAVMDGGDVVLSWATASEENNAGFEIEQSFDGGVYQSVGFIDGNGTTTELNEYSFRLASVDKGTHSYRLKQVDFDGAFEYSEVVEVTREIVEAFELGQLYPNPFNPTAKFDFIVAEDQQVDVSVYNVMGQKVDTIFSGQLNGQKRYTFDYNADSSLPSGQYIIRAQGRNFLGTTKATLLK